MYLRADPAEAEAEAEAWEGAWLMARVSEREETIAAWTAVQKAVTEAYRRAQMINGEAGHAAALLLTGVSESVYVLSRNDLADLERTQEAASEEAAAAEQIVHELGVKQCCRGAAESNPNPFLEEFRKGTT